MSPIFDRRKTNYHFQRAEYDSEEHGHNFMKFQK